MLKQPTKLTSRFVQGEQVRLLTPSMLTGFSTLASAAAAAEQRSNAAAGLRFHPGNKDESLGRDAGALHKNLRMEAADECVSTKPSGQEGQGHAGEQSASFV